MLPNKTKCKNCGEVATKVARTEYQYYCKNGHNFEMFIGRK
jgi:hypothetical protein